MRSGSTVQFARKVRWSTDESQNRNDDKNDSGSGLDLRCASGCC